MKVVALSHDVLSAPDAGGPAFGSFSAQLARMAIGLGHAFVFQAPASSLVELAGEARKGIETPGPALFSVYSGCGGHAPALSPFLLGAAALQARVFPAFVYEPAAGPDLLRRFRLVGNPQVERAWAVATLAYEDADHQRRLEELSFTPADFAAADARFASLVRVVDKSEWSEAMKPVADGDAAGAVPYVPVVDEADRLHRAVVSPPLVAATRLVAATWRHLQELAGIDNSHARRALEIERAAVEEARKKEATERPAAEAAPAARPRRPPPRRPRPSRPRSPPRRRRASRTSSPRAARPATSARS